MEAFSLLKYWRTAGTTAADARADTVTAPADADAATSPYSSDGEDGPYFDLEFALPDQESDAEEDSPGKPPETEEMHRNDEESDAEEISVQDEDEEEGELKFALAADGGGDQNAAAISPSDELFFKGDLVSVEPSGILLNGSEESSRIPVFLLKSATKFRVLLLKLKKSKSLEKAEKNVEAGDGKENPGGKVSGKLFAVKFKVEEVPIVSLFTRDSSSKENHGSKPPKHGGEDSSDAGGPLEDRKLTKEVVQKYLKMVKPFYIRASKRYVEKLKFSGHLSGGSRGCVSAPAPPEAKGDPPTDAAAAPSIAKAQPNKPGSNLQAGLKVVRKRLGKSRSASAAVPAAPAAAAAAASNRRDDSLLQVQDGIQGAILHCKRSFNASRDGELSSSSILCRSVSDPSYEKSVMIPKAPSSSSSEGGAN